MRVFYAFGHQHLGLTLGPVTGEIVASMACEGKVPQDVEALTAERFALAEASITLEQASQARRLGAAG